MKIKDWNNQIRAANAALALKAHREAKMERGISEDDITDLIIDLLHLKALVSEESMEGLIEYAGSTAIDEECDEAQADIAYEAMPDGGMEELKEWIAATEYQSRELLTAPPEAEVHEPDVSLLPKKEG